MNLNLQSYKGTRDIYPEDMRLRNYIFGTWRRAVESFGYEEYDAPLLEPLEIYAAKSGAEIVNDQTYSFKDRGDRVVAIRPEMTPSVSRMVAARRQEMPLPARLYSISNFMRYERPQKGREREFWQLNVDLFGAENIAADTEIITISDAIMREFGADETMFTIRVNDRRLTDFVMRSYLGLNDAQSIQMIKLFDRREKISADEFREQILEITKGCHPELDSGSTASRSLRKNNVDSVREAESLALYPANFSVKNSRGFQNDKSLDYPNKSGNDEIEILKKMPVGGALSDLIPNDEILTKVQKLLTAKTIDDLPAEIRENPATNDLKNLFQKLRKQGISSAKFDPTLMRGFDYYTGIVFEVFDEAPENRRAMFGGGRYDGLIAMFGVESLPVVGMAPGETTTIEFLRAHNLIPKLKPATQIMLIPIGETEIDAEKIANKLRENKINVAIDFTDRKMDKKIKAAANTGIPYALFVGEDEIKSGEFKLKNLAAQTEQPLTIDEILATIQK